MEFWWTRVVDTFLFRVSENLPTALVHAFLRHAAPVRVSSQTIPLWVRSG